MSKFIHVMDQGKIKGLRHAIYICMAKKASYKNEAYNVACDEIKICLEAAIERIETGEDMNATCIAN